MWRFVPWIPGGYDANIVQCCKDNDVPPQCLGFCMYEPCEGKCSTNSDEPINPGYPTVCELYNKIYDKCEVSNFKGMYISVTGVDLVL